MAESRSRASIDSDVIRRYAQASSGPGGSCSSRATACSIIGCASSGRPSPLTAVASATSASASRRVVAGRPPVLDRVRGELRRLARPVRRRSTPARGAPRARPRRPRESCRGRPAPPRRGAPPRGAPSCERPAGRRARDAKARARSSPAIRRGGRAVPGRCLHDVAGSAAPSCAAFVAARRAGRPRSPGGRARGGRRHRRPSAEHAGGDGRVERGDRRVAQRRHQPRLGAARARWRRRRRPHAWRGRAGPPGTRRPAARSSGPPRLARPAPR